MHLKIFYLCGTFLFICASIAVASGIKSEEESEKFLASAKAAAATGQLESAKTNLRAAIDANPKNESAFLFLGDQTKDEADKMRGFTAERQKTYRLALVSYLKAAQLNPKNPDAQFKAAETYNLLNAAAKAKLFYEATLALRPDYPGAKKGLEAMNDRINRKSPLNEPDMKKAAPDAEEKINKLEERRRNSYDFQCYAPELVGHTLPPNPNCAR